MLFCSPGRFALAALVVCASAAGPVAAAPPAAERVRAARAHYELGVSHYNLDEFEPALAEFTEAYRLKPDPSFLFNIAQCHRKLGHADAAIDFFRKYLRNLPEAPNRPEIERMIADLQARAAPPPAAPLPAVPPPAVAPAGPPPAPAPPAVAAAPLVAVSTAPAPPPAATPLYRRWWFWAALGAVAVGGVAIALAATSEPDKTYVGTLGTTSAP